MELASGSINPLRSVYDADNKLELVVTVEVDKANQSIKSVNASLSSMEAFATKSAKVPPRVSTA